MDWNKIKVTNSMTQTMFLDNQIEYGFEAVQNSIKMQSLLFDKLLINRAYFLNNPDLVKIFKNRENNGFGNLIEKGAVAPVMAEGKTAPSFITEWENSKNENMVGLNTDKKYVEELDLFFENMAEPASYVSFDYTNASKNYRKLIKKYCNVLTRKGDFSNIEDDAQKRINDIILDSNEQLTRSWLYNEFEIPSRGQPEYKSIQEKKGKTGLSKNIIKGMFDVNYNFNIPDLNNFNFEYVNAYPPGCDDEKELIDIDPLEKSINVKLVDFKDLTFYDVVNIRTTCDAEHKDFLGAYESLKTKYNNNNIEMMAHSLKEYICSISNLLTNEKYNKKFSTHKSWISLDCSHYKCGRKTFVVHELKVNTDLKERYEPLFQMVLNVGIPEDETRKTESNLNPWNTNDTGNRGL